MANNAHPTQTLEEDPEADLLKRMEAADELRRAWVVNPKAHRWAVGVCAFMGAWGVICGWIVFLKVYGETLPQQGRRESDVLTFVIALFVAAVVGFIAETMQEIINRGRDKEKDEAEEPAPTLRHLIIRRAPRIVFAIVVIALFDLYSDAWNDFAKNLDRAELVKTFRGVLLPPLEGVKPTIWWDFAAIALLWVAVGALLAAVIAHLVIKRTGRHTGQVRTGLKAGLLAGCVAAPLGVLAYVLLTRAVLGIYIMLWEHARWDKHLEAVVERSVWAFPIVLLDGIGHAPYEIFGVPVVGPLLILAFVVWLFVWSIRSGSWSVMRWLLICVGLIFAAPLFEDFANVAWLLASAALVWGIPGAVLGMSMPYLKRPSREPRLWGLVALVSSLFIMVLTWYRLAERGFIVAALLLLVAGFFLLRSRRIEEYWPLLALCVAMVICGVMMVMQKITFYEVLKGVHAANSLPPDVRKRARETLVDLKKIEKLNKEIFNLPEESEEVKAIKQRIIDLNKLPPDEQFKEVAEKIPAEIESQKLAAAVSAWSAVSWRPTLATPLTDVRRNLSNCDLSLAEQVDESTRLPLDQQLRRNEELRAELKERFERLRTTLPPSAAAWAGSPPLGYVPRVNSPTQKPPDEPASDSDLGAIDGRYWLFYCPPFRTEYLCSGQIHRPQDRLCAYGKAWESAGKRKEFLETILIRGEYPDEFKYTFRPEWHALNSARFQIERLNRIKEELPEIAKGLEDKARAYDERRRWEEGRVAQKLELSLTGSLGFWVTIGLLAGWALVRNQRLVEMSAGGGPARCFWAKGDLAEYHDREHGVSPADDRELFRRLSLELLAGDAHRERRDFFDRLFDGFAPERVALMSVEDLRKTYDELKYAPERQALGANMPEGVGMVIDNAKRLVEFYERHADKPDSAGQTLLREWRLRADADPEGLISHFRSFFRVPSSMPVGTFLQSVGLIPGAHFEGCAFGSVSAAPQT